VYCSCTLHAQRQLNQSEYRFLLCRTQSPYCLILRRLEIDHSWGPGLTFRTMNPYFVEVSYTTCAYNECFKLKSRSHHQYHSQKILGRINLSNDKRIAKRMCMYYECRCSLQLQWPSAEQWYIALFGIFQKFIIILTHLSDLVCFRHNGRLNLGTPTQRSHNGADSRVIFIHHLSSYKFGKLLPMLIIYRMLCFKMWYTGADSRQRKLERHTFVPLEFLGPLRSQVDSKILVCPEKEETSKSLRSFKECS